MPWMQFHQYSILLPKSFLRSQLGLCSTPLFAHSLVMAVISHVIVWEVNPGFSGERVVVSGRTWHKPCYDKANPVRGPSGRLAAQVSTCPGCSQVYCRVGCWLHSSFSLSLPLPPASFFFDFFFYYHFLVRMLLC